MRYVISCGCAGQAVVDAGGIQVIVETAKAYSDVEVLQRWCLNAFGYFALDGELRKLIVEASGISVILDTLMQPSDDRVVEQAILAMQHFVFDPVTRKVCPISDIIVVLSRVLRRNCSNTAIMESTVRMLSTIVYHKDCFGLFEEHNVTETLQSIIDSYPDNVVIRHHGMQTMKSVYHNHGDVPTVEPTTSNTVFKMILVGCTNVGKTCIVIRACRNEFSTTVKATLGVHIDFAELEFPSRKVTVQLYDTAGQEQYRALTRNFYRGAHAALLVYDTTRPESFEELAQWHEEVRNNAPSDVIFAVVGSKCDLEADRMVEPRRAEKWAKSIGAQHYMVSAVANVGITKTFRSVTEQLMERWPSGVPKTDERTFMIEADDDKKPCSACM
jgi:small GTP-binding protein